MLLLFGFLRKLVTGLVVLALLAGGLLSAAGLLAKPGEGTVAIVFGSKVELSGQPSERLKARLNTAGLLFNEGKAKIIFVSGGVGDEGFSEPKVMADYLIASGIPAEVIHQDEGGIDTASTCTNARLFMDQSEHSSANVVTQYFHVPRAVLACRRAGIDVNGAQAPRFFEPRDIYSIARELIALPVYITRGRSESE